MNAKPTLTATYVDFIREISAIRGSIHWWRLAGLCSARQNLPNHFSKWPITNSRFNLGDLVAAGRAASSCSISMSCGLPGLSLFQAFFLSEKWSHKHFLKLSLFTFRFLQ
jgi:hypothetical protein